MGIEQEDVFDLYFNVVELYGKYRTLYNFHCEHDCKILQCKKWETDQIQERYRFILEILGDLVNDL